MPDAQATSTYHVESLARGLAALSLFSEERPTLSLTDVSQLLDLNKTTTLRILSTLESLGYVTRDPQTKLYRPALAVFKLGFVVLGNLEVRRVAAPYLTQLAETVQETVNLVVLDNTEVIYIDRVQSKHMVNSYRPIGSRLPAYCTSTGKAILAFLPTNQLDQILNATRWTRYTENTIVTPLALKEDLQRVRERGFAVSNGELIPELRAVAAPIYHSNGQVIASVNISVPTHRSAIEMLMNELGPTVVNVARQISETLGYSVPLAF
ncbi:MAG: IclR family transcriptional regulator [Chloroflexi bacterium]|nr:MAG: IclR family transcriptional regulator [Chloroflexota bacterium]